MKKTALCILIGLTTLNGVAHADYSRKIQAATILCTSAAKDVSVKVVSNSTGSPSHTIQYSLGTSGPVNIEVPRSMLLSSEGTRYIQTFEGDVSLTLGEGDIDELAQSIAPGSTALLKAAYQFEGHIWIKSVAYELLCLGNFAK